MTFTSILLTTVLLAPAQQPSDRTGRSGTTSVESGGSAMSEHIQVLRQILRQRLGRGSSMLTRVADGLASHPVDQPGTVTAQNNPFYATAMYDYWRGNVQYAGDGVDAGVEGVYLPGYGVVFTATLPKVARATKAADDKPATKPLSDWDRAQLELRGEKPEATPSAEHRPPSLRDVILRVLADNGRHFTRLRDDERLTVVITFRDGSRAAASNLAPSLYSATQPATRLTLANQMSSPLLPAFGATQQPAVAAQSGKNPSSARDYEMLADLHLKQQHYQAATDAYEKALAAYKNERGSANPVEVDEHQRQLTTRLAQSMLGLGQNDEAMNLLAQAKSSSAPKPSSTAREQPKSRVPAKLIVSATRRQMEQVANGGMTFDEFRKAATVEEE